jgi:hypothetical protein
MKKILLVDFSPIWVRFVFNGVNYHKEMGGEKKKELGGIYDFNEYADVVIFNTISEITTFKHKFNVDEIVLAFDTKEAGKYWRHDLWSGYKHGRRKDAEFDWKVVHQYQDELKNILDNYSTWKVVSVPRAEGDDVIFTLVPYLDKKDEVQDIIVSSADHDITQCLGLSKKCHFWETKATAKNKEDAFVNEDIDVEDLRFNHSVFGDRGDYIQHIKAWSKFSKSFREKYPDIDEVSAYPKRYEINEKFKEKFGVEAYSHPRFGRKMFDKSQKSLKEVLKENPIYELNYELNKKLVLSENVPKEIQSEIIATYERANTKRDIQKLMEYFQKLGAFELTGSVGLM